LFAIDACDREVMGWLATSAGISGEMVREHDENGHNVNARTSPRKQHDGAAQYAENHQHRACHGRRPVAKVCSSAWIGASRL
jgi:hypothetical protein